MTATDPPVEDLAPTRPARRRPVAWWWGLGGLLVAVALLVATSSDRDRPSARVETRPDGEALPTDPPAGPEGGANPARPGTDAASTSLLPGATTTTLGLAAPADAPRTVAPRVTTPITVDRDGPVGTATTSPAPAPGGTLAPGRPATPGGETAPPPGPTDPTVPVPTPNPPVAPPPATVPVEPPVDPYVEGCTNLGLVPIGDATGSPPEGVRAAPRFRAMATTVQRPDAIVCARAIETWMDDIVVQQLIAAGKPAGRLIGGLAATDPVLAISEVEWTSFRFRVDPNVNHNYAGVPRGREVRGGVEIIRTSNGGIVMARADSLGFPVVGGAWDVWLAHGGPAGDMGLPTTRPTGDEKPVLRARQDFTHGTLVLPGVATGLEAEVQPASRYVWQPLTEQERAEATPPVHSLVEVLGDSYYVDRQGVRHWVADGSDYQCARYDLGATVASPRGGHRGWIVARFPQGPRFVCPSRATA